MKEEGGAAAQEVAGTSEPVASSRSPRVRKAAAASAGASSPSKAKKATTGGGGKGRGGTVAAAEAAAEDSGQLEAAVQEEGAGEGDSPPAKKRARTGRRTKAAKGEEVATAGDDGEEGAAAAAAKPSRARKSKAKAAAADVDVEAAQEPAAEGHAPAASAKPKPKAKAKGGGTKAEPAAPLPQYTMAMRKPPPSEGVPALNILSWNVAGLRALLKKTPDALSSLVEREGAEVLCLQEHKLQGGHTAEMEAAMGLKGWHHVWAASTDKLGYSGVSVHTRAKPLSVSVGLGHGGPGAPDPDPEHEGEGRVVTVELEGVFVVCAYVPNSSEGLKRLDYRVKRWDGAFAAYLQALQARGKPVVLTGDLNCAHTEIDIHAPKTNLRSAGFTVEERESFGRLLLGETGLVDTFRRLHPGTVGYTYFTRRFNCREQNKGWRLDYFLTSGSMMPSQEADAAAAEAPSGQPPSAWTVYDSWIMQDVYGSDHLPLGLTLVKQ